MRYLDASPIRRTERVAFQASSSEEIYRNFIEQGRLGDAVTVDASLSRWFNIGRSRLSLTLSVRNLLGEKDIVYGGYESSRIRNYMSGAQRIYTPQDDVLTYSYPRTYYAVVSWKF
jgi:outer membrane receptor protein involved in Fe transport